MFAVGDDHKRAAHMSAASAAFGGAGDDGDPRDDSMRFSRQEAGVGDLDLQGAPDTQIVGRPQYIPHPMKGTFGVESIGPGSASQSIVSAGFVHNDDTQATGQDQENDLTQDFQFIDEMLATYMRGLTERQQPASVTTKELLKSSKKKVSDEQQL